MAKRSLRYEPDPRRSGGKLSRRERKCFADTPGHVIKPKFEVERTPQPLRPMNELQAEYIELIGTKKCVIATGFAGTSKTYIPTVIACDLLRAGKIKKLYITRPNTSESKSLGYFSGDSTEKMKNWLMPVLSTMYERLTPAVVDLYLKDGSIECVPLETIKGRSFGKDTFVICDEAEDLTIKEVKSVLTRQGGGTMVLCGDIEQSALDEDSGLAFVVEMSERHPELRDFTGFVDFNRPSDIVRGAECKAWVLAMRREGV